MSEKRKPDLATFKPSEFMRARRPERFSDTEIVVESKLDKTHFEYVLSTLTNRGQEKDFEHFCRRLAEKEICPNLLPQTGPTGGGDSKVDSETYPVSQGIALLWYEGIDQKAASERWAFAVSAKEKWHSKVKSDVKKMRYPQKVCKNEKAVAYKTPSLGGHHHEEGNHIEGKSVNSGV